MSNEDTMKRLLFLQFLAQWPENAIIATAYGASDWQPAGSV